MEEEPKKYDESKDLSSKTIDNIGELSNFGIIEDTIHEVGQLCDLIRSLSNPSDLPLLDIKMFEKIYPNIEKSFHILLQEGKEFLKRYEKTQTTQKISDEARDIYNLINELERVCCVLVSASEKINLNIFSDEKKDILHDSGVSYTTLEKINYPDSEDPLETHLSVSDEEREKIKSAFFDFKNKLPKDTHSNFELAIFYFKGKLVASLKEIENTANEVKKIADEFPEIGDGIITGDKILRGRK